MHVSLINCMIPQQVDISATCMQCWLNMFAISINIFQCKAVYPYRYNACYLNGKRIIYSFTNKCLFQAIAYNNIKNEFTTDYKQNYVAYQLQAGYNN